ncbi:MAG: hypothetical protein CO113_06265 [Elusimicrobia bacterium CG_4_9_14_3_um_filter_62_55]|nr:MAG: hypothetical protein CO113_06265 [Elusimicrobia bacterium CG_4_9_14_3_um_filter_62_55]
MKYRTIDEAEAAIPLCEEIFSHAVRLRDEAEQKAIRLREVEMGESPDAGESALLRSQLQFLVNGVNEWMRKIVEFGAMPKGLEPGLVDFPYRHEGRLGGVSVKFPSLECLLANKRATGRPKDLRDAESLDPGE